MVPSVDGPLAILAGIPLSFVAIFALRRFFENRQNKHTLPPGPVPLPLLGNVLSINTKEPWLTYTDWRAAYGDLIFVRILDQEVVVINSQHVAEDLLDKRSRIYSDRPYLATLEPYGWSVNFAFIGYGDEWRLCRRLFHQTFRPESAVKFRPVQIRRAHEMIVNLIDDPQNYHNHFATFSSSVAMSTVYDYDASARDDPLVQIVINALIPGLTLLTPERAMMLKAFPFLLKLPDWCWGSSIKRGARASTERVGKMVDVPFRYVQENMADGSQSSMVAENLRRMETQDEASKPMLETALKKAATTAIVGSYETTTATLMVFLLAMVSYPDVQRRAQAEIESVIGRDRLPTFEDRPSLPYIDAVLRETFRWHPIAPLGLAHSALSADIYNGYFIPQGALVVYNTWCITRDETRYPDASRFIPERFIDVDGALTDDDPAQYIFGLGRRICPGRSAADASVWSAIVTMLATVDISSAKDDQGKLIDFTPKFTPGVVRYLASPCHCILPSLTVSLLQLSCDLPLQYLGPFSHSFRTCGCVACCFVICVWSRRHVCILGCDVEYVANNGRCSGVCVGIRIGLCLKLKRCESLTNAMRRLALSPRLVHLEDHPSHCSKGRPKETRGSWGVIDRSTSLANALFDNQDITAFR